MCDSSSVRLIWSLFVDSATGDAGEGAQFLSAVPVYPDIQPVPAHNALLHALQSLPGLVPGWQDVPPVAQFLPADPCHPAQQFDPPVLPESVIAALPGAVAAPACQCARRNMFTIAAPSPLPGIVE